MGNITDVLMGNISDVLMGNITDLLMGNITGAHGRSEIKVRQEILYEVKADKQMSKI